MQHNDRVVMFGVDVGTLGGVFRVTDGLTERFGEERCFDTPISEAGIMGGRDRHGNVRVPPRDRDAV